jgi:uncharacterized membrane protein
MSEMIAVSFHGKHRAAEVLDQLQQMNDEVTVDLQDGVAAYRNENGKLRIESSVNPTGAEGAGLGGSFGLLIGALLAAPFTGGASAAAAAAAVGTSAATAGIAGAALGADDAIDWKERFGLSDDFVKQIGGMIQPGDSAVFALLQASDPRKVAERFAGYGGKILRTTMKPVDAKMVQDLIRAA